MDKATPFSDLLVPKLTASVTDGAVGVAVDSPVTVTADDGVLASVEMVNENGGTVDGRLSPDGVHWSTSEKLGYNRIYTLTAKARGLGGMATRQLSFQTHSPHNLAMPYPMPTTARSSASARRSRSSSTRTSRTAKPPRRPSA